MTENDDNRSVRQFFALLRAGLWGSPVSEKLFAPDIDWRSICHLAKKQSVAGVVADGMNLLPPSLKVDNTMLSEWVSCVLNIEESNKKINEEVCRQAGMFEGNGFPFILLKGQGCASNYPAPLHRQPGDIDVYVGKDKSEEIKHFLISRGNRITYENRIHFCYKAQVTSVECHKLAHHFYCPWLNKAFQRDAEHELLNEKPDSFICNGKRIAIPNPTFNAFYVFIHFFEHFYHEGVGLRQICDWALLLKAYEAEISWDKVYKFVRDVHAMRAWKTFYAIAKKLLGLQLKAETEAHPLFAKPARQRDVRFVVNDILTVGNMGKYGAEAKASRMKKYHTFTIHPYVYRVARIIYLMPFYPEEKICHPLWALCNAVGIVKK